VGHLVVAVLVVADLLQLYLAQLAHQVEEEEVAGVLLSTHKQTRQAGQV